MSTRVHNLKLSIEIEADEVEINANRPDLAPIVQMVTSMLTAYLGKAVESPMPESAGRAARATPWDGAPPSWEEDLDDPNTFDTHDPDGPIITPPPADAIPPEESKEESAESREARERFAAGRVAFHDMMSTWAIGYGCPTTSVEEPVPGFADKMRTVEKPTIAQPDRIGLIMRKTGEAGKSMLAYINHESIGDLRAAVLDAYQAGAFQIPDYWTLSEDDVRRDLTLAQSFCYAMAGNIVQVSSIQQLPYSDLIKYTMADNRYAAPAED